MIAVGIIVFFLGLFNGFAADDLRLIVGNPTVQSIANIFDFFRGSIYYESGEQPLKGIYYRPLMLTFFALNSSIFGVSPFPLHLLQVSLHIVNSILVFYLFKYFFSNKLSLFLSLIFLVHPINSESVLHISALQENLFFFFGVSSLLLLMYKKEGRSVYILAPLLLFLSLLSKETGILFLLMIAAFILLYQKDKISKALPFIVPVAIYLLIRIPAVGLIINRPKPSPIAYADLQERILNIPSLINFYLVRFVYPKDLVFVYNEVIKGINFTNFYFPLIIVLVCFLLGAGLGVFVWVKRKSERLTFLFFVTWFIIGLGLHLQIIPLDLSASERWFYFPIVGALGVIGILGSMVDFKLDRIRKIIPIIAVLLIVLLSIRTIVRSYDWRDNFTLASHDIRISKNDYLIHGSLAYELAKSGNLEDAKRELKKSIELFPHAIIYYNNYCSIQAIIGQKNNDKKSLLEGIACLEGITKKFDSERIYKRLIPLLFQNNELKKAEHYANEAIKRYPDNASFKLYLDEIKNKKASQNSH